MPTPCSYCGGPVTIRTAVSDGKGGSAHRSCAPEQSCPKCRHLKKNHGIEGCRVRQGGGCDCQETF